jgi:hypothetical protein
MIVVSFTELFMQYKVWKIPDIVRHDVNSFLGVLVYLQSNLPRLLRPT